MPSSNSLAIIKRSGFSLVELLVIVSLITILSVTGLVMFQSARGKAQEAKYRGDVDAIKKAYEKNYNASLNNGQGGYKVVQDSDFVSGKKPKDKNGNDYITIPPANPDGSVSSYAACINPQTGEMCTDPNSQTCSCATSTQGAGSKVSNVSNPTCDPYGILGNGLVGYWKMDEASWTNNCSTASVIDSSGSDNNGKSCPNTTGTQPVIGKVGNAGSFDGVDDYISTPLNIDQSSSSSGVSYSAWVYPTSDSAGRHHIISTDNAGFDWSVLREGGIWYVFTGGGSINTGVSVDLNTWQHLAAVFIPGIGIKFYKNSIQINISSIDYDISDNNIGIGKNPGYPEYFAGLIDDARVYNRALSASEITALYNGGTGCVP